MAATVSQPEPARIVRDASYVPPHLQGLTQQNGQLRISSQVPASSQVENLRPPHMLHVSPLSLEQSPSSFNSAAGLQPDNQSPLTVASDTNHQVAKVHFSSAAMKSSSQEDDFMAFLNRKNALDEVRRTQATLLPGTPATPATTGPAPVGPQTPATPTPVGPAPPTPVGRALVGPSLVGPTTQSTPPAAMQMPPAQRTNYAVRGPDFDTKGTNDFLAFLQQKKPVGKVYTAIDNSPDLRDATNQAEIVRFGGAAHQVAVTQNGIEKNMPADRKARLPNIGQVNPSVTRGEFGVAPSAAAAGIRQQGNTAPGNVGATQNKGNSNNAVVPQTWDDTRLEDVSQIHKAIYSEIMSYAPPNPEAARLTEESLVKNSGWAPRMRSEDSFCGKISDSGLEKQKEKVRAEQGIPAAKELLDWDNTWLAPAADWGERYVLDLSFMPNYIREDWAPYVPSGPSVTVDTTTEGFRLGKLPVNGSVLATEVIQPDCIPGEFVHYPHPDMPFMFYISNLDLLDIENSENEEKRLRQTAEMDAIDLTKKRRKRNKNAELYAMQTEARHMEIEALELAPHPYAPATPVYLR